MKIAIVYCYPMVDTFRYFPLAQRFASTLLSFPAGKYAYELHVVCNGASPTDNDRAPFNGIPATFHRYSNIGWDIGAFQWAASEIHCDMMVCLGAPIHFYRPNWLDRMVDGFIDSGGGLCGIIGYIYPNLHIRTTAFWFPPVLLDSYPLAVGSSKESRYQFEHGNHSFTRHVLASGFQCSMVTWNGIYEADSWLHDPWHQPWSNNVPGPDEILLHDQHIHR